MPKKVRIAIFLLGLAVFSYLVLDYGLNNILAKIQDTGWWFLPIVAIWAAVYFFNAWAWFVILGDVAKRISFKEVYALTVSGFAINYITPFMNLGGEPYRVMALRDELGTPRAVSSVILYNMVRMLSHFFFWLGAIVLALVILPLSFVMGVVLTGTFVLVMFLIVFFYARHQRGIFESLLGFFARSRLLRSFNGRLQQKRDPLLRIDEQIKHLYHERRGAFYGSIGLEFVARIIASFEFYFIGIAIGLNLSVLDALYINAATSLILNLLFFVPFEAGTREGGLYLVMETMGHPAGLGIYMGLVNRLRELFWIFIGLLLVQLSGRKPSLQRSIQTLETTVDERASV